MTTSTYNPTEAFESLNEATAQAREFGERITGTSKALGHLTLDTYEKAVASVVDFENKAAESSSVEWVKTALGAHAKFVEDVNAAYVKAVRGALG